jgi:hypothetical protein
MTAAHAPIARAETAGTAKSGLPVPPTDHHVVNGTVGDKKNHKLPEAGDPTH